MEDNVPYSASQDDASKRKRQRPARSQGSQSPFGDFSAKSIIERYLPRFTATIQVESADKTDKNKENNTSFGDDFSELLPELKGDEKTRLKKLEFLKFYKSGLNTVLAVCAHIQIGKTRFYDWKNSDDVFRRAVEKCEVVKVRSQLADIDQEIKQDQGFARAMAYFLCEQGEYQHAVYMLRHAHYLILKQREILQQQLDSLISEQDEMGDSFEGGSLIEVVGMGQDVKFSDQPYEPMEDDYTETEDPKAGYGDNK